MQLYQTPRQHAKILEVINRTLDTECKTSSAMRDGGVGRANTQTHFNRTMKDQREAKEKYHTWEVKLRWRKSIYTFHSRNKHRLQFQSKYGL